MFERVIPGGVEAWLFAVYVATVLLAVAIGVYVATKGRTGASARPGEGRTTLRAALGGALGACAHPVHALFILMAVFGDSPGSGFAVAGGSLALGAVFGAAGWQLLRAVRRSDTL